MTRQQIVESINIIRLLLKKSINAVSLHGGSLKWEHAFISNEVLLRVIHFEFSLKTVFDVCLL